MKIEISDSVQTQNLDEVVGHLVNSGVIQLDDGEEVRSYSLECGCDLEVEIGVKVEDDPRCSGYSTRTETITESDIRENYCNADYCTWAKDENGDDILVCFGAC